MNFWLEDTTISPKRFEANHASGLFIVGTQRQRKFGKKIRIHDQKLSARKWDTRRGEGVDPPVLLDFAKAQKKSLVKGGREKGENVKILRRSRHKGKRISRHWVMKYCSCGLKIRKTPYDVWVHIEFHGVWLNGKIFKANRSQELWVACMKSQTWSGEIGREGCFAPFDNVGGRRVPGGDDTLWMRSDGGAQSRGPSWHFTPWRKKYLGKLPSAGEV